MHAASEEEIDACIFHNKVIMCFMVNFSDEKEKGYCR